MENTDNTTNSNNDSGKELWGLLLLGALGYVAYKSLTSPSDEANIKDRKPHLSSYDVEGIVNRFFRNLKEDEVIEFTFSCFVPNIIGVKKDLYDRMLLDRLTQINNTIKSMLVKDFEGYNPVHGEVQLRELMSFIKNDCYNEIKETKFFAQLKGNVLKHIPVPGMKLIGGTMNANVEYKILKAINKGLREYFSALYVYGAPIAEAKKSFQKTYVYCFIDSVDF